MIAIINYRMGNVQSVANAFAYLKEPAIITSDIKEIEKADRLVLPGVGAFGEAMNNLRDLNLLDVLHAEVIKKKKPFLGICLGMQLLATVGYENGEFAGLGWVPGKVVRIKPKDALLPIPHVGWNDVVPREGKKIYSLDTKPKVFYFVHSYVFECDNDSDVSGDFEYGGRYTASVERDNIFATQFHPEKSQTDGIALLKNFIASR